MQQPKMEGNMNTKAKPFRMLDDEFMQALLNKSKTPGLGES